MAAKKSPTKASAKAPAKAKPATSAKTQTAPSKEGMPLAAAQPSPGTSGEKRPFAHSPAPQHLRVDPGSAATEYMKSLLPAGAPAPVFSTMALMHGKEASGASAQRKGFSWNPQMDLLWALGYPSVLIIVDGFPAKETPDANLDYWNPERATQLKWWFQQSEVRNPVVLSRRGAFAVLSELATDRNPMSLDSKEFLAATEPRELSSAEARERLMAVPASGWGPGALKRAAMVLEALVGPDTVVDALCSVVENAKFDKPMRYAALGLLDPMRRRLTEASKAEMVARLGAIAASGEPAQTLGLTLTAAIAPLEVARENLADGEKAEALTELDWLDEPQDLVAECHAEFIAGKPETPDPRTVFPGGLRVLAQEAAYFPKYDAQDALTAFVDVYSTLPQPGSVSMALHLLTKKEARDIASLWLSAHAAEVRPILNELSSGRDAKVAKAAKTALESI